MSSKSRGPKLEIIDVDEEEHPASISAPPKVMGPVTTKNRAGPLPTFSTGAFRSGAPQSTRPVTKTSSVVSLSDSCSSSGVKRTSSEIVMVDDPSPPPKRTKQGQTTSYTFGKDVLNVPPVSGITAKGKGKTVQQQETVMEVDSRGSSSSSSLARKELESRKASCERLKDYVYEGIIEHLKGGHIIDLETFEKIKELLRDRIATIERQIERAPMIEATHPRITVREEEVALSNASASALVDQTIDEDHDDDAQYWGTCDDMDMAEISEMPPTHASDSPLLPTPSQTSHTASSRSPTPSNAGLLKSPYYPELKLKLKTVFRLDGFRTNQLEAATSVMAGDDTFVLMPTGGGKSLCYQLPAVCTSGPRQGVSIVVTPLVALMNDQVGQLVNKYHVKAVLWNAENELNADDRSLLHGGKVSLLYVTPEKLAESPSAQNLFTQLYRKRLVARFVIDEAHCISTWGQDFRSAYTNLGKLRDDYPDVPIVALTATASKRTIDDIVHQLKLRKPVMLTQSFNRPNLSYIVIQKPPKFRYAIVDLIKSKYARQSGVVYCRSREACEQFAQLLSQSGVQARHYHAGMDKETKQLVALDWQENRTHVVVATIAFGMGIDKPDVRFVIHYDMPKCISGYYQETGRAGRDGKHSDCILYYNYGDLNNQLKMIRRDETTTEEAKQRQEADLRQMFNFACNLSECRRVQLLQHFDERFDRNQCRKTCDTCKDPRETLTTDVTDYARSAKRLAESALKKAVNLTANQFMNALQAKQLNGMKSRGADTLDGFGGAKDANQDLTDLVIKHLVFEGILAVNSVPNGSGFHNDMIVPGPNAGCLDDSSKRIKISWRPKIKGAKHVIERTESSSSAKVSKKRRKGGIELADDPIDEEDMFAFPDEQPSAAAPTSISQAQRASFTISAPPASRPHSDKPRSVVATTNAVASSSRTVPPLARVASDPVTELLCRLEGLRDQIARQTRLNVNDLLDDQTLQMIAAKCPDDYLAFKEVLAEEAPDHLSQKEREDYAEDFYRKHGKEFVNLCIDSKTRQRERQLPTPAPTSVKKAAELQMFKYQPVASPIARSASMSATTSRPAAASGTGNVRPAQSAVANSSAPIIIRPQATSSIPGPSSGVPRQKKFTPR